MNQRPPPPDAPFYGDLDASLEQAFALLARGVVDRRSAFHQASVATVTADGAPAVRTVVLRGVDRAGPSIRFHTDARSRKVAELERQPAVAVHFYDHGRKIQLRLRGTAALHRGDALAGGLWSDMRAMSRACYRQPAAPGTGVADPADVEGADPLPDDGGFANFVAVVVRVETLEWLYLAARGHRRAVFAFDPDGAVDARWLAP